MELQLSKNNDDLFLIKPLVNNTTDVVGVYEDLKKTLKLIVKVTYDELVSLVENEELIPGQQYRITDYVTTSSQTDTRSALHPFDIIVTALDNKTLDENAKAIPHERDTYFANCDMESWEIKYCLKDAVEYRLCTYRYDSNTNKEVLEEENYFAYMGTFDYSGTTYHLWKQKNQDTFGLTTEFYQPGTLNNVYFSHMGRSTNEGVDDQYFSHIDRLAYVYTGLPSVEGSYHLNKYTWSEGNTVERRLCTYMNAASDGTDTREILVEDNYFVYIGTFEYNNAEYYLWEQTGVSSKIWGLTTELYQPGNLDNDVYFSYMMWGENADYVVNMDRLGYVYYGTPSVNNAVTETVNKGVIYYMKDEWNNECPYDFKNIQFKRWAITDVTSTTLSTDTLNSLKQAFVYNNSTQPIRYAYQSSNITTGSTTFVVGNTSNSYFYYTFTWIDENNQVQDASIVGQTLLNDENQYSGVYDNCIKPAGEYYTISGDGDNARFVLSSNVFVSSHANDYGYFYGVYGNNLGVDCYNNSFGNQCHDNSFGNNCYGNLFANNCYNNSFGNNCHDNSLGNRCHGNSFGNECQSNLFGNECLDNSFGGSCYYNSFGNVCYNNSFGNNCQINSFGIECHGNSFGNVCYNNSFGNNCQSNAFGNECHHNSFGNQCQSNLFGNECYQNSFEYGCLSNSFGIECHGNSFGTNCMNNLFGNRCLNNTFLSSCSYNSFGNTCVSNTFLSSCSSNSFGPNCSSNSFGPNCYGNSFETSCHDNSFGTYCGGNSLNNCSNIIFNKQFTKYCIVENGNQYITLTTTQTTSASSSLRNIQISLGVRNNASVPLTITHPTVNDTFKTIYANNTNGELVSWNPADHVIPRS